MAATDFFKVHGATSRQDGILKHRKNKYSIFYGFGKDSADDETGYSWRKDYDHCPTIDEIRRDINTLVNSQTDAKILTGLSWNGKPVYLSTENQINFKAAYDLAVQTDGSTLPVKFKLGETPDGEPVYHTFNSLNAFSDFFMKAVGHVIACTNAGWAEKDSVDYSLFEIHE